MSLYRASSPIFDVPEFPALRRVKPLPKRRRTDVDADAVYAGAYAYAHAHAHAHAGEEDHHDRDHDHDLDQDVAALGAATELLLAVHHHHQHHQHHRQNLITDNDADADINISTDIATNFPSHIHTQLANANLGVDTTTTTTTTTTMGNVNLNPNLLLAAGLESLQHPLPGPDATAEEVLKHAETLSARMALQSYYMPLLSGDNHTPQTHVHTQPELAGGHYAPYPGAAGGVGGRDEDDRDRDRDGDVGDEDGDGDGDYIDHLRQPGNTKKRKVPSAVSSRFSQDHSLAHSQDGGPTSDSDDGGAAALYASLQGPGGGGGVGGGGGGGGAQHEVAEIYQPPPVRLRRGKLTAATLAGLQHKEMLRTRKRQLAAVLGALSHGDTLALDQALSASYPFTGLSGGGGGGGEGERKVRLSRRRTVRAQRAVRRLSRHPDQAPFPLCEFSFVCHSATADRLIATKEEVAMLRKRFEAELSRQAAKAAKMASNSRMIAAASASSIGTPTNTKGRGKAARGVKSKSKSPGEQPAEFLDPVTGLVVTQPPGSGVPMAPGQAQGQGAGVGKGGKAGKKKKRSAMANASNPHHLRNYVPSRLPHSVSATQAAQNANANANSVSPLPLRFLSAEIPPRRRGNKKSSPSSLSSAAAQVQQALTLTNPGEEWICAFCEYALFYGEEEGGYRRAVRNRKKILRRRRRARERAAAAASGNSTLRGPERESGGQEEYEVGYEGSTMGGDEVVGTPVKQGRGRGDGRERGGGEGGYG